METKDRFPLLRKILAALGLPAEAIDDIVERILDWLAEKKSSDVPPHRMPFRLRDDFLSRAEYSFCRVLMSAVGGRLVVCPKVNLGDLFFVATGDARENRVLLNRIDRKHVDFLLCDPTTLRPVVGIELDDSSHQRPERQARDALVDEVFAAAGLPLVRVPARDGYVAADLESLLRPYLHTPAEGAPSSRSSVEPTNRGVVAEPSSSADESGEPRCPKCAGPMIMRIVKTGANAGRSFWGCRSYPRCRGIVAAGKPEPTERVSPASASPVLSNGQARPSLSEAWEALNRPVQ